MMIDEILLEAEDKMDKTVEHTRENLSTIRAGRATAAMFSHVMACLLYTSPSPRD